MSFTVYILFSKSTQKYYTGSTQDLENRLLEHNSGETKSIKHGIPWEVVWNTLLPSRAEAIQLEIKIKKRGAKRFIQDLGVLKP
jgi:putative endonuclease